MSSTWKIIVIVAGAALLMGLGYWSYQHYRNIKGPQSTALEAIHPDVVYFAQSTDVRAALYKVTKETDYWPDMLGDSLLHQFQSQFIYVDSLVSSQGWLNELFELHKFTLSFNQNPEGFYDFIYLLELPPGDFSGAFDEFVESVNGPRSIVMRKEFERAVIQVVNLYGPEELFYYAVYKGLFIGSFDESLVQLTILQLDSKEWLPRDGAFRRIHSTAGKNVDANIYVRIPGFVKWMEQHLTNNFFSEVNPLQNFGRWTEVDLLVNSKDLLFNGYTIANDSSTDLLHRFEFPSQAIRVPEILPHHTSWMMHWGISNFREFLRETHTAEAIKASFAGYEKDFGIDLEEEFISWVGHEAVLAVLPSEKGTSEQLVVLHSEDVLKAALALGEMEEKVNRKNRTSPFQLIHNDYNIRKLGLKRLFRDLLGPPFPVMENCYYVTLKDYILFSADAQVLIQVIDHFYSQKTLNESTRYQAFSDNISDRSNIYLYGNLREPDPLLNKAVRGFGAANFLDNLLHFEGFALQFSYINGMFYTNMFLGFNPEFSEVETSNWSIELEAPVATKPFFVRNHRSGKTNIIVFDELNNMYLLDHVGRIQWKLELAEKPAGEVYMIDFYDNRKFQYLFNTTNYVYLVDLNGNPVSEFPRKLVAPSTGPLTLFDYDSDGQYRLMVPLNDNKVHNFNLQLEPINGWNKVQSAGRVSKTLQHLRNGGKDYILVADDQGHVKVTDRRGIDRVFPRSDIMQAKNSRFYLNRTNSKGLFLTTDKNGKVVYINLDGGVSRTDFGTFDPSHFFFYADFDGDDHHDFIYVDRNRMVVFDRFKAVIAEHSLAEVVTRQPVLFSWAGRQYIGVALDAVKEIQVFDHQGRRFQEHFIEGDLPFATGSLESGRLNLVTGKGTRVLNYQLN
jgi:hypothetical protein